MNEKAMTMSTEALKFPKVIWLQWHGDAEPENEIRGVSEKDITWSVDKIYEHDVRYVHESFLQQKEEALKSIREWGE